MWIGDTRFSSEGEEGIASNVKALLKTDVFMTTAFIPELVVRLDSDINHHMVVESLQKLFLVYENEH